MCGVLGVAAAYAQPATVVILDELPVFTKPSDAGKPLSNLRKGDAVSVDFKVSAEGGAWCAIRTGGEELSGYVRCSGLQSNASRAPESVRRALAPIAATSEASLDQLISVSGIRAQFEQVTNPKLIAEGLLSRGVPPEQSAVVTRAIRSAFAPEMFLNAIRAELKRGYDPQYVDRALAWYNTPVARRVTAAETAAVSPANVQRFADFARQLQSNPPEAARLDLVRRLEAIVDVSELQMTIVRSLLRGIAARVNPTLPPEKRLDESRLNALMAQLEQQKPAMKDLATARLLHTYSSVSEADLAAYVSFWETPHGRWLRNAYIRGSMASVEPAALMMVDALQQSIPRKGRASRQF